MAMGGVVGVTEEEKENVCLCFFRTGSASSSFESGQKGSDLLTLLFWLCPPPLVSISDEADDDSAYSLTFPPFTSIVALFERKNQHNWVK